MSATPTSKLLRWYDKNRRVLAWRALPGQKPDPYHVWLSEIMLQQTTVATVTAYFQKFIDIWPT
ncbi:MAG: A/G-specific adenine glycosylase, partial [Pseudomonadota bacterium]|nr:A/G-specific adenine glycosylase [Pseudomonadota bacterium]